MSEKKYENYEQNVRKDECESRIEYEACPCGQKIENDQSGNCPEKGQRAPIEALEKLPVGQDGRSDREVLTPSLHNTVSANAGGEACTKPQSRGIGRKICAVVLSAAMFGSVASVAFYGVNRFLNGSSGSSIIQSSSGTVKPASTGGDTLDVKTVASENTAAMVSINAVSVEEARSYFGMFSSGQTVQSQSSGSGIIIAQNDNELLCVTNAHVIENASEISVSFVDSTSAEATVRASSTSSDLAVISVKLSDISDDTKANIKTAVLGDSSSLSVGDQVVAIGNALGYGQSVTTGIVSALDKQLDDSDISMIQTDAAINPGNSGGALLNMKGEVVGINTAKAAATEVEGMGYAISISDALPIIEQLIDGTSDNGQGQKSSGSDNLQGGSTDGGQSGKANGQENPFADGSGGQSGFSGNGGTEGSFGSNGSSDKGLAKSGNIL